MLIATFVLVLLLVFGGWMIVELLKNNLSPPPVDQTVAARHDLSAYQLLGETDLSVGMGKTDDQTTTSKSISGSDASLIDKFKGRYLLAAVKKGEAVTDELVAPSSLTTTLGQSFVTAIAASSLMTIGGQLHVGDKVDLIAVPARQMGQATSTPVSYEDLLVLGVPVNGEAKPAGDSSVIVLAISQDKREGFAASMPGATLLLTKKIKAAQ